MWRAGSNDLALLFRLFKFAMDTQHIMTKEKGVMHMTDLNENVIEIWKLEYEIRVIWMAIMGEKDINSRLELYDKIVEKQNRISELKTSDSSDVHIVGNKVFA